MPRKLFEKEGWTLFEVWLIIIVASLFIQGIPLISVIVIFELLRSKTISRLNIPMDEYKAQIKLTAPLRYMMAPFVATIICCFGTGLFLYIFFFLQDGHISSGLLSVATAGSFWPVVATTIVINKLFKMKQAFQVVKQEIPFWYFVVWPLIMTGFQFCFWIMVINTPLQFVFMEIN